MTPMGGLWREEWNFDWLAQQRMADDGCPHEQPPLTEKALLEVMGTLWALIHPRRRR